MSTTNQELLKRAEELEQTALAMRAFAEGKKVQWKNPMGCRWHDTDDPKFEYGFSYRSAPEPHTRPWQRPEDVPLGCWILTNRGIALVTGFFPGGLALNSVFHEWDEIKSWEHSTDRLNWKPCVVTEDGE